MLAAIFIGAIAAVLLVLALLLSVEASRILISGLRAWEGKS